MTLLAASTFDKAWYTWQDSNLRPLAPQFETVGLWERVREVEHAVSVYRRSWLFGVVVVNLVVKQ